MLLRTVSFIGLNNLWEQIIYTSGELTDFCALPDLVSNTFLQFVAWQYSNIVPKNKFVRDKSKEKTGPDATVNVVVSIFRTLKANCSYNES